MNNLEVKQSGSDRVIHPPLDAEVIAAGIDATDQFLQKNAENFGLVLGIPHFNIRVARMVVNPETGQMQSEGWSTNLETGDATADPKFFIEKGYSPEKAAYATMHEIEAHIGEIIRHPQLTREVIGFVKKDETASIFHNIFSDIAGNNRIHARLPASTDTAADLYSENLFPESDYTSGEALQPRHLQFLYKIIRQEMIPGSETAVFPEVDKLIDALRNFRGHDLIKNSTAVATEDRKVMPPKDRFDLWTKLIYPKFLELVAIDKQDARFQSGAPAPGMPGQSTDIQPGKPDFDKYYKDYRENRHPEPMSGEEHKQIHREVEKRQRTQERAERDARDPKKLLDAKVRGETGHPLRVLDNYKREVERWRDQIQEMRDVFKLIINERVAVKRRLQGGHTEGVILGPETLAQTFIDVGSGVSEPAAFMDYERSKGEREITGKTDWIFIFDRSGSMAQGNKAQAAGATEIICLEGLAGMQRDIEAAEEDLGADLDLDIRTAAYTFTGEVECPKPLSHTITEKQRLDTYTQVTSPGGENADSVALAIIEGLDIAADRRKILVVVSDGEADDTEAAGGSVKRLRSSGWQVYGIAIGSEAAERLYAPDSRRVDDPNDLPEAMKTLIQSNLTPQ